MPTGHSFHKRSAEVFSYLFVAQIVARVRPLPLWVVDGNGQHVATTLNVVDEIFTRRHSRDARRHHPRAVPDAKGLRDPDDLVVHRLEVESRLLGDGAGLVELKQLFRQGQCLAVLLDEEGAGDQQWCQPGQHHHQHQRVEDLSSPHPIRAIRANRAIRALIRLIRRPHLIPQLLRNLGYTALLREDLKDSDRLLLPFEGNRAQVLDLERIPHQLTGPGSHHYLAGLGYRGLDAGSDVHRIAEHGNLLPLVRSDGAGHHLSAIDPHPHFDGRVLTQLLVQLIETPAHFQSHPHSALGVILLGIGCAEYRHDAVSDELVQSSIVFEHHVGHPREVLVEKLAHRRWLHLLRYLREANDVGEDHGDFELLHILFSFRQNALGDRWREIFLETLPPDFLLLHFAVETGLLDGHCRVVTQGGQQLQVRFPEGVGGHGRVDMDDADDLVSLPERRTHGGAYAVETNAVTGCEARIYLCVRGEDGNAVPGHSIGDRLTDSNLAFLSPVTILDHPGLQVAFLVEQHEKPAVCRDVLEYRVHDSALHLFGLGGNECLGQLGEAPQDVIAPFDVRRLEV